MDHSRLIAELGAVVMGSGLLAVQARRHKQEKAVHASSIEAMPLCAHICHITGQLLTQEFLRASGADLKLELEMIKATASSRGRALV